ncbi:MAG: oxidoreductase, partial [Alphaproteobacteria bacterium]|nr:oxidoreductase [Alphaproteobacteria bacterium]
AHGFEEMIEVFGSEGMLESRRQPALGVALWKQATVTEVGLHGGWYERFAPTYEEELRDFLRLAAGERVEIATLSDGVRAQAVAEAAIVAMRQGGMQRIAKIW